MNTRSRNLPYNNFLHVCESPGSVPIREEHPSPSPPAGTRRDTISAASSSTSATAENYSSRSSLLRGGTKRILVETAADDSNPRLVRAALRLVSRYCSAPAAIDKLLQKVNLINAGHASSKDSALVGPPPQSPSGWQSRGRKPHSLLTRALHGVDSRRRRSVSYPAPIARAHAPRPHARHPARLDAAFRGPHRAEQILHRQLGLPVRPGA